MILDDLYAREINYTISSDWDGGITSHSVTNATGSWRRRPSIPLREAVEWLGAMAEQHHPDSNFGRARARGVEAAPK